MRWRDIVIQIWRMTPVWGIIAEITPWSATGQWGRRQWRDIVIQIWRMTKVWGIIAEITPWSATAQCGTRRWLRP